MDFFPSVKNRAGSLEDRRPYRLSQFVGNREVVARIRQQMSGNGLANAYCFLGPTGVGKTTLARIIGLWFHCLAKKTPGEPCGLCKNCVEFDPFNFTRYSGAEIEKNWNHIVTEGRLHFDHDWGCTFVDEFQDLSEVHQKWFLTAIERAKAMVIIASTHRHKIVPALLNRFGSNLYELRYPAPEELVQHLQKLSQRLQLTADPELLLRICNHFGCDVRRSEDVIYCAARELADKVLTVEFADLVLGPVSTIAAPSGDVAPLVL